MEDPVAWTQKILGAIDRYDPLSCTAELQAAGADVPAGVLMSEVIAPCLYEAGARWHSGRYSIVQEHMLSSAVLRHLAATLDRSNRADARHAVAFVTLAGDRHGVGALMAAVEWHLNVETGGQRRAAGLNALPLVRRHKGSHRRHIETSHDH